MSLSLQERLDAFKANCQASSSFPYTEATAERRAVVRYCERLDGVMAPEGDVTKVWVKSG